MIKSCEEKSEYCGYIDVTRSEDKVSIYHELGGMESEDNTGIHKLLSAINTVKGIEKVMINEDFFTMRLREGEHIF